MTTAELEARNLSLRELMPILYRIEDQDHPHIFQPAMTREIINRLTLAKRIATCLEDSLFYARMFKDSSEEGRARREEMIDDAVDLISLFRNGGIYP